MLTVGDRFPSYRLKAVSGTDLPESFPEMTDKDFTGKWKVYVFWPKDFTFVCPTEILAFDELDGEFRDRDAQIIGASTDSDFVHLSWRRSREDLGKVKYPWLSDIRKELSASLGILDPEEGVAKRATFVVDPDGIIRFVSVTDMNVGRNVQEVLRVLDALQTDELCPCNWQKGTETLKAA
ncbi:MAG: peroxiredoxin [Rhodospirillales bacterium]|nr:peroxiredoxin [Rhodospirillales bacterium]